jgi:hypothetical protein
VHAKSEKRLRRNTGRTDGTCSVCSCTPGAWKRPHSGLAKVVIVQFLNPVREVSHTRDNLPTEYHQYHLQYCFVHCKVPLSRYCSNEMSSHRFGRHKALGGGRHGREALRLWFEGLGRLAPTLQLLPIQFWVSGNPGMRPGGKRKDL